MSIDEAVRAIRKLYLEEDFLLQEEIDEKVYQILTDLWDEAEASGLDPEPCWCGCGGEA